MQNSLSVTGVERIALAGSASALRAARHNRKVFVSSKQTAEQGCLNAAVAFDVFSSELVIIACPNQFEG